MAKSSFPFKILFSFIFFGEKKKSKSKFWSDGFFFGLGRFSIYWGRGTSQVFFFDKRPLNVGRHVEINLKLIHRASGVKTHTFGRHVENENSITWTN